MLQCWCCRWPRKMGECLHRANGMVVNHRVGLKVCCLQVARKTSLQGQARLTVQCHLQLGRCRASHGRGDRNTCRGQAGTVYAAPARKMGMPAEVTRAEQCGVLLGDGHKGACCARHSQMPEPAVMRRLRRASNLWSAEESLSTRLPGEHWPGQGICRDACRVLHT